MNDTLREDSSAPVGPLEGVPEAADAVIPPANPWAGSIPRAGPPGPGPGDDDDDDDEESGGGSGGNIDPDDDEGYGDEDEDEDEEPLRCAPSLS
jgi:hypothetical protein